MKIAQILNGNVHSIFEADSLPNWPPDPEGNPIVLVDVTNVPGIKEGWEYKPSTGEFTEVIFPEPAPIPEVYSPTNAEVAQMISDLQADLIIAGVIS